MIRWTVTLLSLILFPALAICDDTRRDLACFRDLQVPLYTSLFRDAGVQGTIVANLDVKNDGSAFWIKVRSSGSTYPLESLVRDAIQAAKLDPACAGQTIEVQFIYRLEGTPKAFSQSQAKVRLLGPNAFEITFPPPIPRETMYQKNRQEIE